MNLPLSTYRIQLHKGFNFRDLKNIIDYLYDLGVHAIYASPILKSRPGSTHGYDVIDPHQIDPEIGTLEELCEITDFLKSKGMMWIQDIVPNHMAFDTGNERLMDVFERGVTSPYYDYFDINWNHFKEEYKGKVMVPFLGDEVENCLERNEIKLSITDSGITISYFDTHYPLSISALSQVAAHVANGDALVKDYEKNAHDRKGLEAWRKFKNDWWSQYHVEFVSGVNRINRDKDLLRRLIDQLHYKLVYWKRSEFEMNYRRFFTVNDLICLNIQHDHVFDEYHRFIKKLYDDGVIQGVRIDHIDGLYDPAGYVGKLRKLLGRDCYIIAEKILEAKEDMPEHWQLEGTSGYEFLSFVNQLITERRGAKELVKFYHDLLPDLVPYDKMVIDNKRLILEEHMRGEWDNLFHLLIGLKLDNGLPRERVRETLALIMLAMPVYRVYPDRLPLKGNDLHVLKEAFAKARSLGKEYENELSYFEELFLSEAESKPEVLEFLKRLMQFTGPLTAKGVEDTTFYLYNPLISHDEVGDAPSTMGISVQSFHAKMVARWKSNRYSLNATATHDTKRGEDARIRLNVLSEMPDVWESQVRQWIQLNKPLKTTLSGSEAPTLNDEYFIYQSLLGGVPETFDVNEEYLKRVEAFLTKAIREAKENSNWSSPNEAYEKAAIDFVRGLFKPDHGFVTSFFPFVRIVTRYAEVYSLIQTVVKLTAPGIPDIYQGCELWDLSYVDPDNRRPVDYHARRSIVKDMDSYSDDRLRLLSFLRQNRVAGFEKLFVTRELLHLRRKHPTLFSEGEYLPFQPSKSDSVMAFARDGKDDVVLIMLPLALGRTRQVDHPYAETADQRHVVTLPESWPTEWKNVLTGETINVAGEVSVFDAFKDFPVAVFAASKKEK